MKRSLFGAAALAAVALTVVFVGSAGATKPPPPPTTNGGCPTSYADFVAANGVVGADVTTASNLSTYTFTSFVANNPAASVPGLVGYCAYANKTVNTATALAHGDDGSLWKASKPTSKEVAFQRPGGNSSNIGYDGTTKTIGTAQFASAPGTQQLVLHIADPATCSALYGLGVTTCYVLPGTAPGPVCNAASSADSNAAYNNIPKDAEHCSVPSQAFEGTSTKEFGDEVQLGKSGNLQSLSVLFNSYACGDNPLWNNPGCGTTPGDTFQQTIRANIYAASSGTYPAAVVPGALLATATQTFTIPYRPSADPTCGDGGGDPSRFHDSLTGACVYSIKKILTFTNWTHTQDYPATGFTAPDHVVWTVEFATSTNGDSTPKAISTCPTAGCPYDSLNVGTKTFDNAPYAGAFVDDHGAFMNSSVAAFYCDNGAAGTGTLRDSTNVRPAICTNPNNGIFPDGNYAEDAWLGWQPLGKIVLS